MQNTSASRQGEKHNSNNFRNTSDSARWVIIIFEIALFYTLIYASVFLGWPYHEFIRFLVLIPLYQAGVAFGFSGGVTSGILVALLFIPIIPLDPLIKNDPLGLPNALAMIIFINIFGIFIGGAIGRGRKVREHIGDISRLSLDMARETDAPTVVRKLAEGAISLTDAQQAAVLMKTENENDSSKWPAVFISSANNDIVTMSGIEPDHPLMWALNNKAAIASNSVSTDDRFQAAGSDNSIKASIIVPVASEDLIFGSLIIANRKNDEFFSDRDLSVVSLLARAAANSIQNIEHERKRQEEKLREEQMKELFSRFVSSSVAEHVLKNPDLLKGRWERITVLVSDIRDFTSISEKLAPHQIVEQLNEYFTRMIDIVFEFGGTIDKFIGDCIIAYWGAPLPDQEHPYNAARAAIKMAAALDELNKIWISEGKIPFRTGIGLHTCEALMGNLGDSRKTAFTIMGEEVEKAMQIESLTKNYKVKIILSPETKENLSGKIETQIIPQSEQSPVGTLFEIIQV
jgi:class 3 adenylate cyclase